MADTVRDIMTTQFDWIPAGDSLIAAGARMLETGAGRLPVQDGDGEFRGVVSVRDIVRVMTEGRDPGQTTAGEVADRRISIGAGEPISTARGRFTDEARWPVVDDGKLVGIISGPEVATHQRTLRELGPAADRLVRDVSPQDVMHDAGRAAYLWTGAAALRPIRVALAAAGRESPAGVLDFGCGHGRVLRALQAAFPEARLTACDLDRDAVDFCARTFGAKPVYSDVDPARVGIEDRFDLIWSGSLFTHIDAPRWAGFLELLTSLLTPGGVLVFTTAGRFVAEEMRGSTGDYRGLPADQARGLLEDYDRTGFGYRDYPGQDGYGHSRCRPSWVCAQLERLPGVELLAHTERGWNGRQDTVACVRR